MRNKILTSLLMVLMMMGMSAGATTNTANVLNTDATFSETVLDFEVEVEGDIDPAVAHVRIINNDTGETVHDNTQHGIEKSSTSNGYLFTGSAEPNLTAGETYDVKILQVRNPDNIWEVPEDQQLVKTMTVTEEDLTKNVSMDVELLRADYTPRLELTGENREHLKVHFWLPEGEEYKGGQVEMEINSERHVITGYNENYDVVTEEDRGTQRAFHVPLADITDPDVDYTLNQMYWTDGQGNEVALLTSETNLVPGDTFRYELTGKEFADQLQFTFKNNPDIGLGFTPVVEVPVAIDSSAFALEEVDGDWSQPHLEGWLFNDPEVSESDGIYTTTGSLGFSEEVELKATPKQFTVNNVVYVLEGYDFIDHTTFSDTAQNENELSESDITSTATYLGNEIEVDMSNHPDRKVSIKLLDGNNVVETISQDNMTVDGDTVSYEIDLENRTDTVQEIQVDLLTSDDNEALAGRHTISDFDVDMNKEVEEEPNNIITGNFGSSVSNIIGGLFGVLGGIANWFTGFF